jgi:type I restriction enzyme, S subunit
VKKSTPPMARQAGMRMRQFWGHQYRKCRKRRAERALPLRAGLPQDLRILTAQPLDAMIALVRIGAYELRAAEIIADRQYMQVAAVMNHKGLRVRPICDGSEIKSPGQCYIREGDILFSRIDIRQGAIGFVGKDLDGAVVIRDFPVFGLYKPTDLARRYFRYVFRSRSFMSQPRNASRGTTGRQKMKRGRFLECSVPWPSESEQASAVAILDAIEQR